MFLHEKKYNGKALSMYEIRVTWNNHWWESKTESATANWKNAWTKPNHKIIRLITKIQLEDIKIYAYHGVLPEENSIGAYYFVNLEIKINFEKAIYSDSLEDTISYADLNEIIHQEMAIPSQLIEHVAGRILVHIEKKYPNIEEIKIKITKTAPPMQGELKGASVIIEKKY